MKKWVIMVIGVAFASTVYFGLKNTTSSSGGDEVLPLGTAQRGDLVIDVLEGGNIQALKFLEFRNEVKLSAGVKILDIIDEGYMVTEEDVENGKILVRLDESNLEEDIVDHDVAFQQTEATYAEAKQNIEIEESEALSEIKTERDAREAL